MVSKVFSASSKMRPCKALSPGGPAVRPNGKSRKTALGGLTDWVIDQAQERETVATPLRSTSLAINPTD